MSKFVGNPQRIVVLEGIPESGIVDLAREIKSLAGRGVLVQLPNDHTQRDWNLENFVDDVRQILLENSDQLIVLTQFTVPERLAISGDLPLLSELELYMGQLPTYAFFLRGSVGFYRRKFEDSAHAVALHTRQGAYEHAYQSTRHARKLMLSADGCTLTRLAQTILFQADLIIREPDPEEDPRFEGL